MSLSRAQFLEDIGALERVPFRLRITLLCLADDLLPANGRPSECFHNSAAMAQRVGVCIPTLRRYLRDLQALGILEAVKDRGIRRRLTTYRLNLDQVQFLRKHLMEPHLRGAGHEVPDEEEEEEGL